MRGLLVQKKQDLKSEKPFRATPNNFFSSPFSIMPRVSLELLEAPDGLAACPPADRSICKGPSCPAAQAVTTLRIQVGTSSTIIMDAMRIDDVREVLGIPRGDCSTQIANAAGLSQEKPMATARPDVTEPPEEAARRHLYDLLSLDEGDTALDSRRLVLSSFVALKLRSTRP